MLNTKKDIYRYTAFVYYFCKNGVAYIILCVKLHIYLFFYQFNEYAIC